MYKFFFALLFYTVHAQAASIKDKNHETLTVSEVTSIYDGDTFRVNIDGLHSRIGERIGIRVAGLIHPR